MITYIPPRLKASTREIAIQKGKYIVGYMTPYYYDVEGPLYREVNLEVQSEETNYAYTIHQNNDSLNKGRKWSIFKEGKQIGTIDSPENSMKKHRIDAAIFNHDPIKIEATWKKTGRINRSGATKVKGMFNHKVQIEASEELIKVDTALLASLVHIFWCSLNQAVLKEQDRG
ncbi:hypothetical protein [Halobacillus sp. A5]|uniref:hypothetical protein n=1 Tax=Halobacillus sp. A5 TaxID=2880263 RepID=UPI0020A6D214|nr:hypothetical protein [Halobacillus sp. A5]MCP3026375.1 hypothetical protein [Halobacillus sp. A5]